MGRTRFSVFLTKAQDGEGCRMQTKLQCNGLKINVVVVHFSRGVNRDKPSSVIGINSLSSRVV